MNILYVKFMEKIDSKVYKERQNTHNSQHNFEEQTCMTDATQHQELL